MLIYLDPWCTSSDPRATPSSRWVSKWHAMSSKKSDIFRTCTAIKSAVGHTTLLH